MRVLSLFDLSGYAVKDFTEAGHETIIVDVAHRSDNHPFATRAIRCNIRDNVDLLLGLRADLVFGFPPCTDLASSGARWWKAKAEKDPDFQKKAIDLCRTVEIIAGTAPFFIENPVGAMSTLWRKPDYKFHPYEYGGYLPEDDIHPDFPQYIVARDAYPKMTCLWTGNGFQIPTKKPVEIDNNLMLSYGRLGGKTERTKYIRSLTPRGFAKALCKTYTP